MARAELQLSTRREFARRVPYVAALVLGVLTVPLGSCGLGEGQAAGLIWIGATLSAVLILMASRQASTLPYDQAELFAGAHLHLGGSGRSALKAAALDRLRSWKNLVLHLQVQGCGDEA